MKKEIKKEKSQKVRMGGIPERIKIFRTFYDENWVKHSIEEDYEYIDHIEAGNDLIIHYRLKKSKETEKSEK